MISRTVLAVVLLVIATVEAKKGDVTFWMDKIKLTCPGNGEWFDGSHKSMNRTDTTLEQNFIGPKEQYHCLHDSESYYFYIIGKACTYCFELDAVVLAVVIVTDVIVTGIVMIMVYKCTKKKTAGPQHAPKAGRTRLENIPLSDHSSPYAPLSHHTRSNDTYSHIQPSISKTG
ncbi:hypothetical protein NL108_011078 [Boleophthalmus pectinirostris]|uniref:T-cell surface glycoprotein CD3 delta chain-like n=1 Tax=Boleophthalmus pectinirostris TaxID=150288 RepID=UPI0024331126|nr:T-cell surface glycoprotein CD3 delta chain-like [Boleophthalmus pectinirostris]KAJ0063833.1 hypothetical protein NL108_011078 [Boleophthalmus pectinirostris]